MVCQIFGKPNHTLTKYCHKFNYSYTSEDLPLAFVAISMNGEANLNFYAESSATSHMTNDLGNIYDAKPYNRHDRIYVGDGSCLKISHVGNANLKTVYGNLKLKDVPVVSNLKKNSLSVGQQINDSECIFEFSSNGFVIKDLNQKSCNRALKGTTLRIG